MNDQLHLTEPVLAARASLMLTNHRRAVLMMVVSAVINSTGGLLVRSVEAASDWQ